MERLALILISLCGLACNKQSTNNVVFNRSEVTVKTIKGICYVNGEVFSGTLVQLASTGDTLVRESYRDGKEHGTWTRFYDNGQRMAVREFEYGKKMSLYEAWWPNGLKRLEHRFDNDEYHGLLKEWDEEGHPVREATYEHGYEEGPQKVWYPNGKIRSNYVMKNGRRFGLLGTKNCVNVADSVFNNL